MKVAAALWGFAEATLFFIVPDVLLTFLAMRRPLRLALIATVLVVAGALVGGSLMYAWGARDPAAARSALDRVPAIAAEMVQRVEGELSSRGPVAVVWGPLRGTPYKIYAVQAGALGIGLAAFLAISIPARLGRFVVAVLVTCAVARVMRPRTTVRVQYAVVGPGWPYPHELKEY